MGRFRGLGILSVVGMCQAIWSSISPLFQEVGDEAMTQGTINWLEAGTAYLQNSGNMAVSYWLKGLCLISDSLSLLRSVWGLDSWFREFRGGIHHQRLTYASDCQQAACVAQWSVILPLVWLGFLKVQVQMHHIQRLRCYAMRPESWSAWSFCSWDLTQLLLDSFLIWLVCVVSSKVSQWDQRVQKAVAGWKCKQLPGVTWMMMLVGKVMVWKFCSSVQLRIQHDLLAPETRKLQIHDVPRLKWRLCIVDGMLGLLWMVHC